MGWDAPYLFNKTAIVRNRVGILRHSSKTGGGHVGFDITTEALETPVAKKYLESVTLYGRVSPDTDFSVLKKYGIIKEMHFRQVGKYPPRISSLSPFSDELETLVIHGIETAHFDLSTLDELCRLKTLGIGYHENFNWLTSDIKLPDFTTQPDLESIYISAYLTEVQISQVSSLTSLKELDFINHGELRHVTLNISQGLRYFSFSCHNKSVQSITINVPDENCLIENISISDIGVDMIDLSPLSGCIHLRSLRLQGCGLKEIDLSPISSLPNLRHISLLNTPIKTVDVTTLCEHSTLESFWYDSGTVLTSSGQERSSRWISSPQLRSNPSTWTDCQEIQSS